MQRIIEHVGDKDEYTMPGPCHEKTSSWAVQRQSCVMVFKAIPLSGDGGFRIGPHSMLNSPVEEVMFSCIDYCYPDSDPAVRR